MSRLRIREPSRTKSIPLTQGFSATVDAEDYSRLSRFRWFAKKRNDGKFVALRMRRKYEIGNTKFVAMHRLVVDAPEGIQVDHINLDSLDNRRCNLRVCTNGNNQMNSALRSHNTSGYKGVDFSQGMWRARIVKQGKEVFLGRFDSPEEAAGAYDRAANDLFGEFAKTNRMLGLLKDPANDK